ncbi:hypothetical protein IIA79_04200, partial [bacterium]|nr:hypothetical protein [bacterium]
MGVNEHDDRPFPEQGGLGEGLAAAVLVDREGPPVDYVDKLLVDAAAAVEAARELIDRWDARAELSKLRSIDFLDVAWVEGIPEPIRYGPRRRQV